MTADIAFTHLNAHPLDDRLVAIGVTNGLISHMWADVHDVDARRTIDCDGATVLPGIDDSHLHGYEFGRSLSAVDLTTEAAPDLQAVQRIVRDAAPETNGWIRGAGWDSTVLRGSGPGGTMTAEDLDAVVPDRPVMLTDMTGHQAWVNSAALRAAGVDRDAMPDPSGGRFERDERGRMTGLIFEAAVAKVNGAIPPLSPVDKRAAILAAQQELLSQGVVAYTDPGLGPGAATLMDGTGDLEAVEAYRQLDASGDLVMRVNVMLLFGGLGGTLASQVSEGLDAWGPPSRMERHGRLGIEQVKVFADGIPRSRTAWMSEPYDDCTHGNLQIGGMTDDERVRELHSIVRSAAVRGWQVGLHTIGDRAIESVVDAVEVLPNDARNRRHYVIHGDFVNDAELARMAAMGMTLNANPSIRWAVGGSVSPLIGEARNDRRQRLRTAWDAGVNVCASSDAPVAPPDWRTMVAAAVTRSWRSSPERTDGERLSTREAVLALTRNAAWQSHAEDWRGSWAIGSAADLVMLDGGVDWDDPWSLTRTNVRSTIVGGSVVWGADV